MAQCPACYLFWIEFSLSSPGIAAEVLAFISTRLKNLNAEPGIGVNLTVVRLRFAVVESLAVVRVSLLWGSLIKFSTVSGFIPA